MKKGKGRAHYEEHGLVGDADDFDEGDAFTDEVAARRGHLHTRQRLEMREEEQRLRKQLADWDDEDFDWESDEQPKARRADPEDEE
ncbi:MAG TPA: hypothetical protein VF322_15520 [Gammaproteobacteria bacterium]